MDSFSWFVLAVLVLVGLNNMHRRAVRLWLVRELLEENKSADDVVKVLKAYKESE